MSISLIPAPRSGMLIPTVDGDPMAITTTTASSSGNNVAGAGGEEKNYNANDDSSIANDSCSVGGFDNTFGSLDPTNSQQQHQQYAVGGGGCAGVNVGEVMGEAHPTIALVNLSNAVVPIVKDLPPLTIVATRSADRALEVSLASRTNPFAAVPALPRNDVVLPSRYYGRHVGSSFSAFPPSFAASPTRAFSKDLMEQIRAELAPELMEVAAKVDCWRSPEEEAEARQRDAERQAKQQRLADRRAAAMAKRSAASNAKKNTTMKTADTQHQQQGGGVGGENNANSTTKLYAHVRATRGLRMFLRQKRGTFVPSRRGSVSISVASAAVTAAAAASGAASNNGKMPVYQLRIARSSSPHNPNTPPFAASPQSPTAAAAAAVNRHLEQFNYSRPMNGNAGAAANLTSLSGTVSPLTGSFALGGSSAAIGGSNNNANGGGGGRLNANNTNTSQSPRSALKGSPFSRRASSMLGGGVNNNNNNNFNSNSSNGGLGLENSFGFGSNTNLHGGIAVPPLAAVPMLTGSGGDAATAGNTTVRRPSVNFDETPTIVEGDVGVVGGGYNSGGGVTFAPMLAANRGLFGNNSSGVHHRATGTIPNLFIQFEGDAAPFMVLENCVHPLDNAHDLRRLIVEKMRTTIAGGEQLAKIPFEFTTHRSLAVKLLASLQLIYETYYDEADFLMTIHSDAKEIKTLTRLHRMQAKMLEAHAARLQQTVERNITVDALLPTLKMPKCVKKKGPPSPAFYYPYVPLPPALPTRYLSMSLETVKTVTLPLCKPIVAELARKATEKAEAALNLQLNNSSAAVIAGVSSSPSAAAAAINVRMKSAAPPVDCGITPLRPSFKLAALEVLRRIRWAKAVRLHNAVIHFIQQNTSQIHLQEDGLREQRRLQIRQSKGLPPQKAGDYDFSSSPVINPDFSHPILGSMCKPKSMRLPIITISRPKPVATLPSRPTAAAATTITTPTTASPLSAVVAPAAAAPAATGGGVVMDDAALVFAKAFSVVEAITSNVNTLGSEQRSRQNAKINSVNGTPSPLVGNRKRGGTNVKFDPNRNHNTNGNLAAASSSLLSAANVNLDGSSAYQRSSALSGGGAGGANAMITVTGTQQQQQCVSMDSNPPINFARLEQDLADKDVPLLWRDLSGFSLLHYAVLREDPRLVTLLCQNSIDVCHSASDGRTAAHLLLSRRMPTAKKVALLDAMLTHATPSGLRELFDKKDVRRYNNVTASDGLDNLLQHGASGGGGGNPSSTSKQQLQQSSSSSSPSAQQQRHLLMTSYQNNGNTIFEVALMYCDFAVVRALYTYLEAAKGGPSVRERRAIKKYLSLDEAITNCDLDVVKWHFDVLKTPLTALVGGPDLTAGGIPVLSFALQLHPLLMGEGAVLRAKEAGRQRKLSDQQSSSNNNNNNNSGSAAVTTTNASAVVRKRSPSRASTSSNSGNGTAAPAASSSSSPFPAAYTPGVLRPFPSADSYRDMMMWLIIRGLPSTMCDASARNSFHYAARAGAASWIPHMLRALKHSAAAVIASAGAVTSGSPTIAAAGSGNGGAAGDSVVVLSAGPSSVDAGDLLTLGKQALGADNNGQTFVHAMLQWYRGAYGSGSSAFSTSPAAAVTSNAASLGNAVNILNSSVSTGGGGGVASANANGGGDTHTLAFKQERLEAELLPILHNSLIAPNIDPFAVDSKGNTLLHWALFSRSAAVLSFFARPLQFDTAEVVNSLATMRNVDGDTPLTIAIRANFSRGVEILMGRDIAAEALMVSGGGGASTTANAADAAPSAVFVPVNSSCGRSPLLLAVDCFAAQEAFGGEHVGVMDERPHCVTRKENHCVDIIIQCLERHGLDVRRHLDTPTGPRMETPLHSAVRHRLWHMAALLLTHHASSTVLNGDGLSPLQLACKDPDDIHLPRLLLSNDRSSIESGASLTACVSLGGAIAYKTEILDEFFFSRVAFDLRGTTLGYTILKAAARSGNLRLLRFALERGAREVGAIVAKDAAAAAKLKKKSDRKSTVVILKADADAGVTAAEGEQQHQLSGDEEEEIIPTTLTTPPSATMAFPGGGEAANQSLLSMLAPNAAAAAESGIVCGNTAAATNSATNDTTATATSTTSSVLAVFLRALRLALTDGPTKLKLSKQSALVRHFATTPEGRQECLELALLMLKLGFEVTETVLCDAIAADMPLLVTALLQMPEIGRNAAYLDYADAERGDTALHLACRKATHGDGAKAWNGIVFALCERSSRTNALNDSDESPLSIAIHCNNALVAVRLILSGHHFAAPSAAASTNKKKGTAAADHTKQLHFVLRPYANDFLESKKQLAIRRVSLLAASWLRNRIGWKRSTILADAVCGGRMDIVGLFLQAAHRTERHSFAELLMAPFDDEGAAAKVYGKQNNKNSASSSVVPKLDCVLTYAAAHAPALCFEMLLGAVSDSAMAPSSPPLAQSRPATAKTTDDDTSSSSTTTSAPPPPLTLQYGAVRAALMNAIVHGRLSNAEVLYATLATMEKPQYYTAKKALSRAMRRQQRENQRRKNGSNGDEDHAEDGAAVPPQQQQQQQPLHNDLNNGGDSFLVYCQHPTLLHALVSTPYKTRRMLKLFLQILSSDIDAVAQHEWLLKLMLVTKAQEIAKMKLIEQQRLAAAAAAALEASNSAGRSGGLNVPSSVRKVSRINGGNNNSTNNGHHDNNASPYRGNGHHRRSSIAAPPTIIMTNGGLGGAGSSVTYYNNSAVVEGARVVLVKDKDTMTNLPMNMTNPPTPVNRSIVATAARNDDAVSDGIVLDSSGFCANGVSGVFGGGGGTYASSTRTREREEDLAVDEANVAAGRGGSMFVSDDDVADAAAFNTINRYLRPLDRHPTHHHHHHHYHGAGGGGAYHHHNSSSHPQLLAPNSSSSSPAAPPYVVIYPEEHAPSVLVALLSGPSAWCLPADADDWDAVDEDVADVIPFAELVAEAAMLKAEQQQQQQEQGEEDGGVGGSATEKKLFIETNPNNDLTATTAAAGFGGDDSVKNDDDELDEDAVEVLALLERGVGNRRYPSAVETRFLKQTLVGVGISFTPNPALFKGNKHSSKNQQQQGRGASAHTTNRRGSSAAAPRDDDGPHATGGGGGGGIAAGPVPGPGGIPLARLVSDLMLRALLQIEWHDTFEDHYPVSDDSDDEGQDTLLHPTDFFTEKSKSEKNKSRQQQQALRNGGAAAMTASVEEEQRQAKTTRFRVPGEDDEDEEDDDDDGTSEHTQQHQNNHHHHDDPNGGGAADGLNDDGMSLNADHYVDAPPQDEAAATSSPTKKQGKGRKNKTMGSPPAAPLSGHPAIHNGGGGDDADDGLMCQPTITLNFGDDLVNTNNNNNTASGGGKLSARRHNHQHGGGGESSINSNSALGGGGGRSGGGGGGHNGTAAAAQSTHTVEHFFATTNSINLLHQMAADAAAAADKDGKKKAMGGGDGHDGAPPAVVIDADADDAEFFGRTGGQATNQKEAPTRRPSEARPGVLMQAGGDDDDEDDDHHNEKAPAAADPTATLQRPGRVGTAGSSQSNNNLGTSNKAPTAAGFNRYDSVSNMNNPMNNPARMPNPFVQCLSMEALEHILKHKLSHSVNHIVGHLPAFPLLIGNLSQHVFADGRRFLDVIMEVDVPNTVIKRAIDYAREEAQSWRAHGVWWVETLLNVRHPDLIRRIPAPTRQQFPFLSLFRDMSRSDPTTTKNLSEVHYEDTPLHNAIRRGRSKVTAHILQSTCVEVDVNTKNNKGRTALMVAAILNKNECASQLVSTGVDVMVEDVDGMTALHHAAAAGSGPIVELILADDDGSEAACNSSTKPMASYPILQALKNGKDDCAFELLTSLASERAPKEITLARTGETLLHFAAMRNCTISMEALLGHASQRHLNALTVDGFSCRDYAAVGTSMDLLLKNAGVKRHAPFRNNLTPVTAADVKNHQNIVSYALRDVSDEGKLFITGVAATQAYEEDDEVAGAATGTSGTNSHRASSAGLPGGVAAAAAAFLAANASQNAAALGMGGGKPHHRAPSIIKQTSSFNGGQHATAAAAISGMLSASVAGQQINNSNNAAPTPMQQQQQNGGGPSGGVSPQQIIVSQVSVVDELAFGVAMEGDDETLLSLLKLGATDGVRLRVYNLPPPSALVTERERAALTREVAAALLPYGGINGVLTFPSAADVAAVMASIMNGGVAPSSASTAAKQLSSGGGGGGYNNNGTSDASRPPSAGTQRRHGSVSMSFGGGDYAMLNGSTSGGGGGGGDGMMVDPNDPNSPTTAAANAAAAYFHLNYYGTVLLADDHKADHLLRRNDIVVRRRALYFARDTPKGPSYRVAATQGKTGLLHLICKKNCVRSLQFILDSNSQLGVASKRILELMSAHYDEAGLTPYHYVVLNESWHCLTVFLKAQIPQRPAKRLAVGPPLMCFPSHAAMHDASLIIPATLWSAAKGRVTNWFAIMPPPKDKDGHLHSHSHHNGRARSTTSTSGGGGGYYGSGTIGNAPLSQGSAKNDSVVAALEYTAASPMLFLPPTAAGRSPSLKSGNNTAAGGGGGIGGTFAGQSSYLAASMSPHQQRARSNSAGGGGTSSYGGGGGPAILQQQLQLPDSVTAESEELVGSRFSVYDDAGALFYARRAGDRRTTRHIITAGLDKVIESNVEALHWRLVKDLFADIQFLPAVQENDDEGGDGEVSEKNNSSGRAESRFSIATGVPDNSSRFPSITPNTNNNGSRFNLNLPRPPSASATGGNASNDAPPPRPELTFNNQEAAILRELVKDSLEEIKINLDADEFDARDSSAERELFKMLTMYHIAGGVLYRQMHDLYDRFLHSLALGGGPGGGFGGGVYGWLCVSKLAEITFVPTKTEEEARTRPITIRRKLPDVSMAMTMKAHVLASRAAAAAAAEAEQKPHDSDSDYEIVEEHAANGPRLQKKVRKSTGGDTVGDGFGTIHVVIPIYVTKKEFVCKSLTTAFEDYFNTAAVALAMNILHELTELRIKVASPNIDLVVCDRFCAIVHRLVAAVASRRYVCERIEDAGDYADSIAAELQSAITKTYGFSIHEINHRLQTVLSTLTYIKTHVIANAPQHMINPNASGGAFPSHLLTADNGGGLPHHPSGSSAPQGAGYFIQLAKGPLVYVTNPFRTTLKIVFTFSAMRREVFDSSTLLSVGQGWEGIGPSKRVRVAEQFESQSAITPYKLASLVLGCSLENVAPLSSNMNVNGGGGSGSNTSPVVGETPVDAPLSAAHHTSSIITNGAAFYQNASATSFTGSNGGASGPLGGLSASPSMILHTSSMTGGATGTAAPTTTTNVLGNTLTKSQFGAFCGTSWPTKKYNMYAWDFDGLSFDQVFDAVEAPVVAVNSYRGQCLSQSRLSALPASLLERKTRIAAAGSVAVYGGGGTANNSRASNAAMNMMLGVGGVTPRVEVGNGGGGDDETENDDGSTFGGGGPEGEEGRSNSKQQQRTNKKNPLPQWARQLVTLAEELMPLVPDYLREMPPDSYPQLVGSNLLTVGGGGAQYHPSIRGNGSIFSQSMRKQATMGGGGSSNAGGGAGGAMGQQQQQHQPSLLLNTNATLATSTMNGGSAALPSDSPLKTQLAGGATSLFGGITRTTSIGVGGGGGAATTVNLSAPEQQRSGVGSGTAALATEAAAAMQCRNNNNNNPSVFGSGTAATNNVIGGLGSTNFANTILLSNYQRASTFVASSSAGGGATGALLGAATHNNTAISSSMFAGAQHSVPANNTSLLGGASCNTMAASYVGRNTNTVPPAMWRFFVASLFEMTHDLKLLLNGIARTCKAWRSAVIYCLRNDVFASSLTCWIREGVASAQCLVARARAVAQRREAYGWATVPIGARAAVKSWLCVDSVKSNRLIGKSCKQKNRCSRINNNTNKRSSQKMMTASAAVVPPLPLTTDAAYCADVDDAYKMFLLDPHAMFRWCAGIVGIDTVAVRPDLPKQRFRNSTFYWAGGTRQCRPSVGGGGGGGSDSPSHSHASSSSSSALHIAAVIQHVFAFERSAADIHAMLTRLRRRLPEAPLIMMSRGGGGGINGDIASGALSGGGVGFRNQSLLLGRSNTLGGANGGGSSTIGLGAGGLGFSTAATPGGSHMPLAANDPLQHSTSVAMSGGGAVTRIPTLTTSSSATATTPGALLHHQQYQSHQGQMLGGGGPPMMRNPSLSGFNLAPDFNYSPPSGPSSRAPSSAGADLGSGNNAAPLMLNPDDLNALGGVGYTYQQQQQVASHLPAPNVVQQQHGPVKVLPARRGSSRSYGGGN